MYTYGTTCVPIWRIYIYIYTHLIPLRIIMLFVRRKTSGELSFGLTAEYVVPIYILVHTHTHTCADKKKWNAHTRGTSIHEGKKITLDRLYIPSAYLHLVDSISKHRTTACDRTSSANNRHDYTAYSRHKLHTGYSDGIL